MTTLRDAVRLAQEYLGALIPDAEDPLLEEVEHPATGDTWYVTLSFVRKDGSPLAALQPRRTFKRFEVRNGVVVAMKIRELTGA